MPPRPILKCNEAAGDDDDSSALAPSNPFPFASCPTLLVSPHVHFPPTPILTSTFSTHSPSTYDRAPIDVSPNSCELPKRGERSLDGVIPAPRPTTPKRSYFHPRAFEACEREPLGDVPVDLPALSPDLSPSSSDSDDLDGFVGMTVPAVPFALHASHCFIPPSQSAIDRENPNIYPLLLMKDGKKQSPGLVGAGGSSDTRSCSLDDGCLGGF